MIGLLQWLVRRVGGMTLLILVLLAICLASLIWVLSTVVRGLDLELVLTLTLVGAVSGWLLARSRVHPLLAVIAAILIALVTSFVRVGQLGGRLIALLGSAGNTLWSARFGQFHPQTLLEPLESLVAAIFTLVTRLQGWSRGLVSGQPVYEPVALALLWGFVVCLVAAWAAWRLRRAERAFDALLPLVMLLALVTVYAGRDTWVMFVVLSAWLGLLAAVPHLARERRWDREAVPFAESLGFDLALIAVPVIVGVLALAAVMPVISPEQIAQWVQPWTESTPASSQIISNSFGIEPAPRPRTALESSSSPGLPRSHLLGAGPDLLKKLALTVRIDDEAKEFPVRYWLGTTYDEYSGHGWFSSGFRTQDYNAGERVSDETRPVETLVHQTVHVENTPGILYAAGTLERVDQSFQVAWRQPGDMFGAQINANTYRVESFVPGFDENALRTAGQEYPAWIRTQYLRVPDNMPTRVLALARDLTATEPTPYDRARAIESYLQTIPYSLEVPLPPVNRDVVDYFLFDLRRGYCDYYATAMVMLARAAGLPARIAVGYAAGEYDPTTRTYRVTEADAHAWTQVYFPNYGWVDFEPTSGRVPLVYDASSEYPRIPPDFGTDSTDAFPGTAPRTFAQIWFVVPAVILFAGLMALGGLVIDTLVLRRSAPTRMINILYHRLVRCARLLGLPITSSLTPTQIGALLEDSFMAPSGSRSLWLRRPISAVVHLIVAQYVRTTYGAQDPGETEAARVIQDWQSVRIRILLTLALIVLQARHNSTLDYLRHRLDTYPRTLTR